MSIRKSVAIGLSGAAITGMALVGTAAASSPATTRVPRYTVKVERLTATAEVLGFSSPSALESQLKTETMKQIIADKGLTLKTARQKIEAEVTAKLEADGYTADEIQAALGHHPRHHSRRP